MKSKITVPEAMQLLGLQSGYSVEDRKKAYRKAVKLYHPDTNHSPNADEIMAKMNEANDVLESYEKVAAKALTHKSIFEIVEI